MFLREQLIQFWDSLIQLCIQLIRAQDSCIRQKFSREFYRYQLYFLQRPNIPNMQGISH